MHYFPVYNGPSFSTLSKDFLSECFIYLDLDNLLTVQLVCKIWYKASCDIQIWKQIAEQRAIPLQKNCPIRATVLTSFRSYCRAARMLFPDLNLPSGIPVEINAAYETSAIDKKICEMNKIDWREAFLQAGTSPGLFSKHLKAILHSPEYIEDTTEPGTGYIAFIQVGKQAGAVIDMNFVQQSQGIGKNSLTYLQELSQESLDTHYTYIYDSLTIPTVEVFSEGVLCTGLYSQFTTIKKNFLTFNEEKTNPEKIDEITQEFKELVKSTKENPEDLHTKVSVQDCAYKYLSKHINTEISFPEHITMRIEKMETSFYHKVIEYVESYSFLRKLISIHDSGTTLSEGGLIPAFYKLNEALNPIIANLIRSSLKYSLLAIRGINPGNLQNQIPARESVNEFVKTKFS